MDPLEKDLGFHLSASLDIDGMLTLTETIWPDDEESPDSEQPLEPVITGLTLPAQAACALLNLLRTSEARKRIGARK